MATFSNAERSVLEDSLQILLNNDSPFAEIVKERMGDIEQLAQIVDRAPSPNSNLLNNGDRRTAATLAKKLCEDGLGHVVNLPTKAVLGHGLIVSKLHLFGLLMKLLETSSELDALRGDIERRYNNLLFTLMAEDLYTALITKEDLKKPWVNKAVHELITMWDERTSDYIEKFGLAIRDLWEARHTIVPVLGTLLGTVEIMRLSALLPPVWNKFLSKVATREDIVFALEEFLFDLTYEELVELRALMAKEQIRVVDRATSHKLLKKRETPTEEFNIALALYKSFMKRQQLAKERSYRDGDGPRRSLEEYFVIYLLSLSKI